MRNRLTVVVMPDSRGVILSSLFVDLPFREGAVSALVEGGVMKLSCCGDNGSTSPRNLAFLVYFVPERDILNRNFFE